jgi:hypothetical protein
MTNLDCPDLLVSITALEFGTTVRTIYFDVFGYRRDESVIRDVAYYEDIARKLGRDPPWYDDLTDVMCFEKFDALELALQRRLGLPYRPTLKSLGNKLRAQGMTDAGPFRQVDPRDTSREEPTNLVPAQAALYRYVSSLNLGGDAPSSQAIRRRLEEVLFGRKEVWLCFREGLITHEEAANKVIAEIESWAFDQAHIHYSGTPDYSKAMEVSADIRRLLFDEMG